MLLVISFHSVKRLQGFIVVYPLDVRYRNNIVKNVVYTPNNFEIHQIRCQICLQMNL